MKFDAKTISVITSHISAAALDSAKWQSVLDDLCRQIPGIKTHLFGHDLLTNTVLGVQFSGYDSEFVDSYTDYYGELNPWAPGFIEADIGRPIPVDWMIPYQEIIKTEFYHDWILPQEDIVAGGGTLLFKEEQRLFALGANIRIRDGEELEKTWLDLIGHIAPHLQQAFEINRALAGLSLEAYVANNSNLAGHSAIFILHLDGRIMYSNVVGSTLLETGEVVKSSRGGLLTFSDKVGAQNLEGALQIARNKMAGIPVSFKINGQQSRKIFVCRTLHIEPFLLADSPFGNLVGNDEPCIILTILPQADQQSIKQHLMYEFGLTAAEADVASGVTEGLTLRQISELRQVSIHTVRGQFKSAMSKLDVNRQIELVRAVEKLMNKEQIPIIADRLNK